MCNSKNVFILALAIIASISCEGAWAGTTTALSSLEVKVPLLVDGKQMTVYVFDKDTTGVSNCNDGCAAAWPPVTFVEKSVPLPYSIITRKDGTTQAAYNGQPLYTYAYDSNPGDINGNGSGGIWHVVASPTGK